MTNIQIAICGFLRTGKDTVGEYIEKNYGGYLFAFGDALKDDFHREYSHIPRHPKPRKGYQLHGQLKRYVHGEDYWLNKCLTSINMTRLEAEGWLTTYKVPANFIPVITDVRQPNEVQRCKDDGFILLRTRAAVDTMVRRAEEAGDLFDIEDLQHETERGANNYVVDYEIENNGTLEELYARIDVIMTKLGVEKSVDRF